MVHKISPGGAEEVISIGKELHDFLLKYNVAMRGQMEEMKTRAIQTFSGIRKANPLIMALGRTLHGSRINMILILG